jgi:hypothetical protein
MNRREKEEEKKRRSEAETKKTNFRGFPFLPHHVMVLPTLYCAERSTDTPRQRVRWTYMR